LPSISSAYAGAGLGRRSSIKLKIFWNKLLDTATSANWNVTYRPCCTTFAPIFADILKPFEVRSNTIRVGESISKGYRRNDIERAAALYLATSPVTTL